MNLSGFGIGLGVAGFFVVFGLGVVVALAPLVVVSTVDDELLDCVGNGSGCLSSFGDFNAFAIFSQAAFENKNVSVTTSYIFY